MIYGNLHNLSHAYKTGLITLKIYHITLALSFRLPFVIHGFFSVFDFMVTTNFSKMLS